MSIEVPPQYPPPPDQAQWDAAATKALIDQLSAARSTAEKWAGTLAALLGAFSSVALLTGTDDISKVGSPSARGWIIALIIVAGILVIAAIVLAAIAAQGTSLTQYSNFDGSTLRAMNNDKMTGVLRKLNWSRFTGTGASLCVFAIGVLSLIQSSTPDTSTAASIAVVGADGRVICGPVGSADFKQITAVAAVVPVSKC